MARRKCLFEGVKIPSGDIVCKECGMPQNRCAERMTDLFIKLHSEFKSATTNPAYAYDRAIRAYKEIVQTCYK